jgi:hypothetical protein
VIFPFKSHCPESFRTIDGLSSCLISEEGRKELEELERPETNKTADLSGFGMQQSKSRIERKSQGELAKAILSNFFSLQKPGDSLPFLFRDAHFHFARLLSKDSEEIMKRIASPLWNWFEENKSFKIGGRKLGSFGSWKIPPATIKVQLEPLIEYIHSTLSRSMRLMSTKDGRIGMAHFQARHGDEIVKIMGCSEPVVLRKLESGYYHIVGGAYVSDVTNNVKDEREWEDIYIS